MSMLLAKDGRYLNPSPAFCHWFAGFTDGEGCFLAKARKNSQWDISFSFNMRGDEEAILLELQAYFGGGIYYFNKEDVHVVSLKLSSGASCYNIYKVFTKYPLRAKKKRDFKLWTQLLGAKLIGIKATDMLELINELKAIKLYQGAQNVSTVPAVSTEADSVL